jgi:hypothetical protein
VAQPLIIQYTNLLHKYRDPQADAVVKFRERHAADKVFLARAAAIDKVWKLKESLVR